MTNIHHYHIQTNFACELKYNAKYALDVDVTVMQRGFNVTSYQIHAML